MTSYRVGILGIVAAALLSASQARADIITFDFTGTNPSASTSWTQTSELDPHLQITTGLHIYTPFADDSAADGAYIGLKSIPMDNVFSFGTEYGSINGGRQTIATAIAHEYWIGFTITPELGYALNLNGATINATMAGQTDYWSPRTFPFFTSIGGFDDGDELNNTALPGTPDPGPLTVTLPSTGYDNITGPLEIRLLPVDGRYSRNNSINALSIDGGSVAAVVPEPSSIALGLAGLGLLALRRRKHA